MVELGGMPILWHIMKIYSAHGFNEFIICAGYKQHVIKEYFADYFLHTSDITYDFTKGTNEVIVHHNTSEPVEGHGGRYRTKYDDRWPGKAGQGVYRQRTLYADLWRWCIRY